MSKTHISIIIPIYGCGNSLLELYNRLVKTLSTITNEFEIIMVNDASPDDAWKSIKELAKKDKVLASPVILDNIELSQQV